MLGRKVTVVMLESKGVGVKFGRKKGSQGPKGYYVDPEVKRYTIRCAFDAAKENIVKFGVTLMLCCGGWWW